MSIVARFKCNSVMKTEYSETASMTAVYTTNPDSPNHKWAVASPNGKFEISIANPKAWGALVAGKEYEFVIQEATPFLDVEMPKK